MKKLRAEIDWIEIEITIHGTTNLKAIRSALQGAAYLEKAYVTVMSDDHNSASTFRFRIHDPNKFAGISAVLGRLGQRFPFALPPLVSAAEIAIDDYSKGPEQVADWYYGLSKIADPKNHRLYRDGRGSGQAIPSQRDSLVRKIADGCQIAIGNKNADFYQHGYYKQTDHNKQPLPEPEHRARIEVTLRGEQLPCVTLDNWADFKFEQLGEYFRFRTPKDNLSDFQVMILEGRQIGRRGSRNRRDGGTRLNNPLTTADPDNERVRNALRNLSRRWKSAQPGRPAIGIACGNSGNVSSINANKHWRIDTCSNNYTSINLSPIALDRELTPDECAILEGLDEQAQSSSTPNHKVQPGKLVLKTAMEKIVCTQSS